MSHKLTAHQDSYYFSASGVPTFPFSLSLWLLFFYYYYSECQEWSLRRSPFHLPLSTPRFKFFRPFHLRHRLSFSSLFFDIFFIVTIGPFCVVQFRGLVSSFFCVPFFFFLMYSEFLKWFSRGALVVLKWFDFISRVKKSGVLIW